MDRRALGVGLEPDPQAVRRPARRLGREIGERRRRLVAVGLERVDAQIERRARGRAPRPPPRARRRTRGRDTDRAIPDSRRAHAAARRRRAARSSAARSASVSGGGRMARAVGELRDRVGIEAALALEHAEQDGARRRLAHEPGRRGAPAQRVIDQPGDGGAVAGAGEAMASAPSPSARRARAGGARRCRRGLRSRRQAVHRGHGRPSRMRTMKITHMINSTSAPTPNHRPRMRRLLLVTWT